LDYFKKAQGNFEFYQNKCHPRHVHETRRHCAKATNQWAQEVAGSDQNFLDTCLHEKGMIVVVKKVSGG
jgi:hypothetical protein